ncbi:MAG: CapA family protein [Cyclobacteriaceae bacterium]|nr:CapA family protein [Cyclobacteriaceae bacterium]
MSRSIILFVLFAFSAQVTFGQDTTTVSLLFVGDVMQHDSQISAAYDPISKSYDYSACFQYVKPIIQSADVAIANLEVTLAGPPYKGYPQFSAPDQLAEELKETGFDILVTANNHSLDRRRKGLERTIDVLDSVSILHTGTFKDSSSRAVKYPLVFEKNGFRFSLLNYTYGTNGIPVTQPNIVNLIDTVKIKADLAQARAQNTDAIIVFMHWGAEYQDTPNRSQKRIAALCFENGAMLVIGAHPHVVQPMERDTVKNTLVAYSLGNFVSGQQSRYRDGGAMLWVELEKIRATDSTSAVQIKEAAYELEWVYRNNESPKKYFILPVKEFEKDTMLLTTAASKGMFKTFKDDSRKLFLKNKNISESDRLPLETSYYRVVLTSSSDSLPVVDSTSILNFYGLNVEQVNDSLFNWTTGQFYDREIAEQALAEIKSTTPYADAKLVWYYWDRRREELPSGK